MPSAAPPPPPRVALALAARERIQGMAGIVISLVHGTFFPGAEWTRPGSTLREQLITKLSPHYVHFETPTWTGANTHDARLSDAADLAAHVHDVANRYPTHHHFLVCHSHAGNVAI